MLNLPMTVMRIIRPRSTEMTPMRMRSVSWSSSESDRVPFDELLSWEELPSKQIAEEQLVRMSSGERAHCARSKVWNSANKIAMIKYAVCRLSLQIVQLNKLNIFLAKNWSSKIKYASLPCFVTSYR